jgi:hypothetical protein
MRRRRRLETGLVSEGGTSAGIWSIGRDTFCKVKAWCEGLEPESDTLRFIERNARGIPLPEGIFSGSIMSGTGHPGAY